MRFLGPPGLAGWLVRLWRPTPPQWQRPSPLPQRHGDTQPSRGPKPPASARPAIGGRFAPAGACAGLSFRGLRRSCVGRSTGAGETRCVSLSRPARWGARCGGFRAAAAGQTLGGPPRPNGKGHRLCHSATVTPSPAGGQSPRPAHAPPSAGAFAPAGACAGLSFRGWHRSCVSVPRGQGKRGAFPDPARPGGGRAAAGFALRRMVRLWRPNPAPMAKAIAFATVPR